MPLSDNAQAIVVFVSALLIALGTAAAALPTGLDVTFRIYVFSAFTVAGAIGFALKEALGSTGTTFTISVTNPAGATWTETNATTSRIKALIASGSKVQIMG
jgi:hypothetical protein